MTWNTITINDFEKVAQEIVQIISERYQQQGMDNACVVCLEGDLGAGKTTLTQIIAKQLGVTETVQSPTFVIKKTYKTNSPLFKNLVHMDAYRLENDPTVHTLRLDEDFKSPETLMMIEWSSMITSIIPDGAISISIKHEKEGRTLQLSFH